MVEEIRIEYKCSECDIEFLTSSSVKSHMDKVHKGDQNQVNKESIKIISEQIHKEENINVLTIIPDPNFITQNTADLKASLEAIPKESLEYEEDVWAGWSSQLGSGYSFSTKAVLDRSGGGGFGWQRQPSPEEIEDFVKFVDEVIPTDPRWKMKRTKEGEHYFDG